MLQRDQLEVRQQKLSPAKQRLLERLKKSAPPAVERSAIPRRPAGAPAPLSFAQQRLWFLDQLEPGCPAYNVPSAVRLRGSVDASALRRALAAIVRRHESLRTVFVATGEGAEQRLAPLAELPMTVADLRGVAEPERESDRLASREARRPFDLRSGPLFRAALIRRADDDHLFVVTMHHIVCDGWSMDVLIGELGALYRAEVSGAAAAFPELGVQYPDFAAWQRREDGAEAPGVDYWRRQLAGAPALLELSADRPRPATPSWRGAACPLRLGAGLREALQEIARPADATLFMALAATYLVLLRRHSGRDDLLFGTPVANRGRVELEGLIGFFVNVLALRVDAGGNPTFTELLGRTREVALGGFRHQEVSFDRLIEELRVERALSHHPLVQVMFMLRRSRLESLALPGLEVDFHEVSSGTAHFDLSLELLETDSGLRGSFQYSTDLWETSSVRRLAAHFERLLSAVAADPEARLDDLPLLSPAEHHALLHEWNDAERRVEGGDTVIERFTARAAEMPEATAVLAGGERLSYRQLDERSDRLARHLRSLGVHPEVRVGLYVERSPEMVVALLAVWKAGGAYVPLDPAFPSERLALMMEDSGARVVVTQESLADRVPLPAGGGERPELVRLDVDRELFDRPGGGEPLPGVDGSNLAYVLFTSGSTGRPKGVQIHHRSLVSFLDSMARRPGLTRDDVVVAVTTISFDIAGLELYLPLVKGARVVLASARDAADGERLGALLDDVGATVLQATPATWRLLLEAGWQGRDTLRVLCGGEALPGELAAALRTRSAAVWNLYGPTETTVWSSVKRLDGAPGATAEAVSLGRPIANTRFQVVDRAGRGTPAGVPGELLIGGEGLSRGYLGRPALTAERFVPDPCPSSPGGERLYRTGDLVRHAADGELRFLGRLDHQVKVRGFRIELGEIESALEAQAAIAQVIVTARPGASGDARLTAFVAPQGGAEVDVGELRAALRDRLPEYMVPAAFVVRAELPLTPNGKVDRKALASAAQDEAAAGTAAKGPGEPPRTPAEELMAGLWSEILEVSAVSRDDSFFDLGGHSLSATRLVARIQDVFGVEVGVRTVFDAPRLADLVSRLATAEDSDVPALVPGLAAAEDTPPLSFAQERLWFIDRLERGNAAYNVYGAMRVEGGLERGALRAALAEVVRRHATLRTVFPARDGQPVAVELRSEPPAWAAVPPREIQRTTPPLAADYPAARLSQQQLEDFLDDLGGDGERRLRESTATLTPAGYGSPDARFGDNVRETQP